MLGGAAATHCRSDSENDRQGAFRWGGGEGGEESDDPLPGDLYGVDVEEDDRKKVISLSHQYYSSESDYNLYPGNNHWPTDSCASCYKDLPALQGPQQ